MTATAPRDHVSLPVTRDAFMRAPVGLLMLDGEGDVAAMNDQARAIIGGGEDAVARFLDACGTRDAGSGEPTATRTVKVDVGEGRTVEATLTPLGDGARLVTINAAPKGSRDAGPGGTGDAAAARTVRRARVSRSVAQAAAARAERYAKQLKGLTEASLSVNASLSLDETLRVITEEARRVIGAHRSATSLRADEDRTAAIHHVSVSVKPSDGEAPAAPMDESAFHHPGAGMTGPVRLTQEELESDPAWKVPRRGAENRPPLTGWLAAPLTGRDGRNIGVIQLSGKESGEFTRDDENVLVQFAQMASVAIENARLYEATRRAQERLNRQLEFTAALTESMGEGVFTLDQAGRITSVNPAAEEILGFPEASLIGKPVHAVLHPGHTADATGARESCPLLSVLHTGRVVRRDDDTFTTESGRAIHVAYTTAPLRMSGELTGAIVTFRDITSWKASRERLRLYREIVASSNDAIGIIDAEGRYMEQNDAHRILLGYSDEDLSGQTPAMHLGDETFDRIKRALAETGGFRGEAVGRAKDGRTLNLEISAFTIRDARGDVICHVGIKRDVTARRAAEQELADARRQVSVSEKLSALGTLVSGVAHEIRTPLTYIANNLHVVRGRLRDAPLTEDGSHDLADRVADALEGVDRINRLVFDLRRFAHLHHGEKATTDLRSAVEEAARLFEGTHRGRGRVIVDTTETPPLPVDKMHVQQIVLNLVGNAADAVSSHGTIRVRTRAESGAAVIQVIDDGPGIPEAVQRRMFDHFFTTKSDGTGLGLAIVHRIVSANGGTITCESREGRGTTFTVRLPLDAQAARCRDVRGNGDTAGDVDTGRP